MVEIKDINWEDKPRNVRKAAHNYIKYGKFNLFDDLEPYFLEANGFVTGKVFDCDYKTRRLIFNSDMTQYYCTPCIISPVFTIRPCADIERVELITENAGQSKGKTNAVAGAVLFGTAGAVVGSAQGGDLTNLVILTVRLYTRKSDEPFVDINVLSTPLSRNNKHFPICMENAKKIYGQFLQIAEANKGK